MFAKFLYKNLCWQFNQKPFAHLLAPSTTEKQYFYQLEKIADGCFPLSRAVDTAETEFCLNKLALSRAKNNAERAALNYLNEFWQQYTRLKELFGKGFLLFPSNATATRIETIAELLCKCTQFAVDAETQRRLLCKTCEKISLTERERHYLEETVRLFKIKYYCASVSELLDKKDFAEGYAARFLQPSTLKYDFVFNKNYRQAAYEAKQIAAVADCMGMSATRLGVKPTRMATKLFVYANGRNVFDTFVQSRFGQRQAEFLSETSSTRLAMRYFVQNNTEIRNCTITNNGKRTRKFTVQIPFVHTACADASYFRMGNALCAATDIFSAVAIVHNSSLTECRGEREQTFDVTLERGASYDFDIVTVFADNSPAIADALLNLERFGATRCPYMWDGACTRLNFDQTPLSLSAHGYTAMKPQAPLSQRIKYSYQLGNSDIATFVDTAGNSATLLRGFVFGVKGESVYDVRNGYMSRLDGQSYRLEGDKLIYENKNSKLCVSHDKGKTYRVEYVKPARTLFFFPLERKSQINFRPEANRFDVKDGARQYSVCCTGRVESFTTDAMECSEYKLRYKLSGNTQAGTCLAICFAPAAEAQAELSSAAETPASAPLIRESLVSTYLNYVNDKNVFCFNNHLKRPDCLSVSAICYTNPQYVRQYIEDVVKKGNAATYYYDSKGAKKDCCDELTLPLAAVCYMNLAGELEAEKVKKVNEALFSDNADGQRLCIKALILLKAAKLACFDRVKCLVEYSKLKKQICADSKLYAYAQAIGALPLTNPSKERLKDLCNRYDIPKSWYYVSQLENLYGLSLSEGKLQIAPKVTSENVLEQFALNIAGKRIDTTFAKASVQCMTLNGQQCFSPFYAPSLKNEQNELVVSY